MKKPIVVPSESERYVIVGDVRTPVSVQEFIGASLNPGDRVRVTPKVRSFGFGIHGPFEGSVVGSMFYDGIALRVEETRYSFTGASKSALLGCGDTVEPLDREVIYS